MLRPAWNFIYAVASSISIHFNLSSTKASRSSRSSRFNLCIVMCYVHLCALRHMLHSQNLVRGVWSSHPHLGFPLSIGKANTPIGGWPWPSPSMRRFFAPTTWRITQWSNWEVEIHSTQKWDNCSDDTYWYILHQGWYWPTQEYANVEKKTVIYPLVN